MAEDDPYIGLEDNSCNDAIKFVQSANRLTMTALGSPPTTSPSYSKILEVLQTDERIPFVSQAGTNEKGERILLNFWKDAEVSLRISSNRVLREIKNVVLLIPIRFTHFESIPRVFGERRH